MAFAILAAFPIHAQSIWTNPITDANPSTANPFTAGQTVAANITVSGIGRGAGASANAGSNRYNASSWNTATLDTTAYFTFTLTPNPGNFINLTSFVYTGLASGSGATAFSFRSSLDGFTADIGTPTATGTTISLSGASYQSLGSAIEFRLYGFGASGASGTFSVNDFTFNGTVTTTDNTAPTLASTNPSDNATGVSTTANLVATFNETVQKGTSGNVVIRKTSDNSIFETIDITTAAVTVAGAVVTIDPIAALAFNTEYYVTIDANAFKDNATIPNNYLGLGSTTAWSFTTLVAVDSTPPTLATTSPVDGATGVSTTANLIATFDETVQKGTSGNVIIKKTSDNSVVDTIDITTAAVTVNGAEVTINPTVTLANSTEYYVTIDANALKDNAASPNNYAGLTSTTAWSFTTEAPVVVWINEIHYDNTSTDTGELVEIAGTAGVNLTGWTIVPYNGFNGESYSSTPLSGMIDNESGTGFGAISVFIAGLQNGAPDGVALVNSSGVVVEFLSYEGSFTATNGPASGLTSTDIGVSESGIEPVGQSLQRNNSFPGSPGAWSGPKTATAGSLNDAAAVPDGSGIATIANLTLASPLLNSPVFGRSLGSQTAAITLTGTFPGSTLTDVTIEVPAAITGLVVGNVSLTGAGSASVSGNTITISGADVTTSTGLTVTIAGLNTPNTSLDLTNDGNYAFTVSTKQSGGTLTALSSSPIAYVVIPIANIRDQDANGVPLDLNDKVAVQGVCTEADFNSSTTITSAFLQEVSGNGVNIFSNSVDSPYLRGNEYVTLGNVIQFNGLSEVSFTSAAASVFNLGAAVTQPTPITATLAAIMLDPESYEGKLVTIANLTNTDATGWPPLTVIPLTDDGGTTILNAYIHSGSTATTSPAFPAAITGVFGQFDNSDPRTAGYQIHPRDPGDIVSSGLTPFQTWATGAPYNLTGNDALFDADPDQDGVSNGIEFIVGSNPTVANDASAFIPNVTVTGAPGSRVATIVYRRTDASTYLNSVLQISPDLLFWEEPIEGYNGTSIVVDNDFYGVGIDKVTVTLDANGPRGFARLRAVATP